MCRGKDISKWGVRNELLVLMLQDADRRVGLSETVIKAHRGTWDFINLFRKELGGRRSSMLPTSPFYSVYGVDKNTFAPFKVVWGRVGTSVSAAVVGVQETVVGSKVVLPFEAMMVPFTNQSEAHFVCGCLNSAPAQLVVVGSIVLHPDTHVMRRVRVPAYDPTNELHEKIASISVAAHGAVSAGEIAEVEKLEVELAESAGMLWGVGREEVAAIRLCLEQIR